MGFVGLNASRGAGKVLAVFLAVFVVVVLIWYFAQWQARAPSVTLSTSPTTASPAAQPSPGGEATNVISVTASNGSFSPANFTVKQHDATILRITAEDRDYLFQLPEEGIDVTIPKGQTVDVDTIPALGVGSYTYRCGVNCSGTLTVVPETDPDEEAIAE